jgi:hypothetical protein
MDFVGLAAWGVIAGLLLGIALHSMLEPVSRAKARWRTLLIGLVAFGLAQAVAAIGATSLVAKILVGVGFLGIPVLVCGIVMLILAPFSKGPPKRNEERPGV